MTHWCYSVWYKLYRGGRSPSSSGLPCVKTLQAPGPSLASYSTNITIACVISSEVAHMTKDSRQENDLRARCLCILCMREEKSFTSYWRELIYRGLLVTGLG